MSSIYCILCYGHVFAEFIENSVVLHRIQIAIYYDHYKYGYIIINWFKPQIFVKQHMLLNYCSFNYMRINCFKYVQFFSVVISCLIENLMSVCDVSLAYIPYGKTNNMYYDFINYGYNEKFRNFEEKKVLKSIVADGKQYRTQSMGVTYVGDVHAKKLLQYESITAYPYLYLLFIILKLQDAYYSTILTLFYVKNGHISRCEDTNHLQQYIIMWVVSKVTMNLIIEHVVKNLLLYLHSDYKVDLQDQCFDINCHVRMARSYITCNNCHMLFVNWILYSCVLYTNRIRYEHNRTSFIIISFVRITIVYCICGLGQTTVVMEECFDLALFII